MLLLADHYPEQTTALEPAAFALARSRNLRLFLEYPAALPGLAVGAPRATTWERLIVSSDRFAPALPRLRILAAHDCHYVPVSGSLNADLVIARVAGYDTAVYGIPEKDAFPMLFELPGHHLYIACTKLSGFVTGRYAPAGDWQAIWQQIFSTLDPRHPTPFRFEPLVEPAYSATAKLPKPGELIGVLVSMGICINFSVRGSKRTR